MLNRNGPPTSIRIKSCVTETADPHETSRNFLRKLWAWLHVLSLYENHIYTVLPLPLWSSFSELSEVLSPGQQSSHCSPKHLTCNSHVVHFFGRHIASGPITSWQIDGETVETVSDFIYGVSKITADGDTAMNLKDAYSLDGKLWPT